MFDRLAINSPVLGITILIVSACAISEPEPVVASGGDELLNTAAVMPQYESIEVTSGNAISVPTAAPEPVKIHCEQVVPTGSVMRVKVCNRQSDIDRKREADQKIIDDIKRNTAIGISNL